MDFTSKTKLLVAGATGLVGSKFVEIYKDKFQIITIGRSNVDIKINLTSEREVFKAIISSDANAVINFAAFTNVDGAEKEKGNRLGEVFVLNAMLPFWLSQACKESGKNLYHISTDYVFSGKQDNKPYTEEDLPIPVDSWYAISKYEGELNIKEDSERKGHSAIIRISYPYSGTYNRKLDFARVIVDKLRKGEIYSGTTDQKIKPTSVDDIAKSLNILIKKKAYGIYHVAGKYPQGFISPYEFAQNIAKLMNLDTNLIRPVTFLELSKKRVAPRPQHTWIDTAKIEKLGMQFASLDQSLTRFSQQMLNNL